MPWTTTILPNDKNNNVETDVRKISYKDAILEASELILSKNNKAIIFGEGATDPAGIYGTTKDLKNKFGDMRVFDTPLSEQGMTGVAIGAAIAGLQPIYIHARMDFILLTLDQLINSASKYCYTFNGSNSVPMVIRCVIARGWGSGPQHSQSLTSIVAHIPGLKVVYPSNPYDVKGMLISAFNDNNPVVFVEHRWLYNTVSYVPEGYYEVNYSEPNIICEGSELTIVSSGYLTYQILKILKNNNFYNNKIELIDLRSLNPIKYDKILDSVNKTKAAVIVDDCWEKGSMASDIAVKIYEHCNMLKEKVKIIALPNIPTPSCQSLEEEFYIKDSQIQAAINGILEL